MATVPGQPKTGKPVTHDARAIPDLPAAIAEHIQDRYSGLTDDEYLILAIYVIHTYFYLTCGVTPYLHIASLTKDCGKSELGYALRDICFDAEMIVPTVATLGQFRETGKHTLIIDEIDSLLASRNTDVPGLWSLLNMGYKPGAPWRVSGQPDRDMFFPKIVIGIGPNILRDTVESRSIRIICRPGTADEQAERERRQVMRPVSDTAESLRYRLARLVQSHPEIAARITAGMNDIQSRTLLDGTRIINRDAEIWRVMITVADAMGNDYGKRMREIAAARISAEPDYLPTQAEMIDTRLRSLMRERKLTALNYADAERPPLPGSNYPFTNEDFGWPPPRNGQRGRLPNISVRVSAPECTADLRIKTTGGDLTEICGALGITETAFKNTYRDASRLTVTPNGKLVTKTTFRAGQPQAYLVIIDISGWLWPNVTHLLNSSAYSESE